MLTQISLMPTSRRCFGNPSSIVPSKAVCTKHRVLCTQQTRPSRGTLIPSAARSRGAVSPLRIYATATTRFVPRAFRRRTKSLPDRIPRASFTARVGISPFWTSRRARRVAANTRACPLRQLCLRESLA